MATKLEDLRYSSFQCKNIQIEHVKALLKTLLCRLKTCPGVHIVHFCLTAWGEGNIYVHIFLAFSCPLKRPETKKYSPLIKNENLFKFHMF